MKNFEVKILRYVFLIALFLVASKASIFSQNTISFETKKSKIQEEYSTKGSKLFTVNVMLTDTATKDLYFQVIRNGISTADTSDCKILSNLLYIKKGAQKGSFVQVVLEVKNDTLKEEDEYLIIELQNINSSDTIPEIKLNHLHSISIRNAKAVTGFNESQIVTGQEFRVDIGANFNFLDELSTNGVYGSIFVFTPDLINVPSKKKTTKRKKLVESGVTHRMTKEKSYGLIWGIYQNRYFSDTSELNISGDLSFRLLPNEPTIGDSSTFERSIFSLRSSRRQDNFGLYINPIIKLSDNKKFGLYFGPSLEILKRSIKVTYEYNSTPLDTMLIDRRSRKIFEVREPSTYDRVFYERYFALRFHILYRVKGINISITPSAGFVVSDINNFPIYYGFTFNCIELVSGINIGGEIRGFYQNENPRIGLYLSKAINIAPLTRYKGTIPE